MLQKKIVINHKHLLYLCMYSILKNNNEKIVYLASYSVSNQGVLPATLRGDSLNEIKVLANSCFLSKVVGSYN